MAMQALIVFILVMCFPTRAIRLKHRTKTRGTGSVGPLSKVSVAKYLDLDYENFYATISERGYSPPRLWKPLGKESSLADVLNYLHTEVSDSRLISLVEGLKSSIAQIRETRADKWAQYEAPLSQIMELIIKDEERRASYDKSTNFTAAVTTLACPGLPCGPFRPTCKFGLHRISKNLTTFSPPLMYYQITSGKEDFTNLFPELSKENLAKFAALLDSQGGLAEIGFAVRDGITKEAAIKMHWYLKKEAWTAKIDFFQVTPCSESGSPLMKWLKDTHARLGFSSILLEDDSRKKCMQSNGHFGQESPLRLWYMLNANQPSEGKSFYESKGFLRHDGYEDSKRVLELKASELRALLECSRSTRDYREQNALKSLQADINDRDPDETIFQWLKRQNLAMQEGNPIACERLTFVSQLFWRNHWTLRHSKCKDPVVEAVRLNILDRLSIFMDSYPRQIFVAQLEPSS